MSKEWSELEDDQLWYKDAIIYEVHVRAFFDENGDGIGDFKGLTSKLDYLEDLGITAIWLLPFYPSPLRDDGYDISDYFDVHPHYGSLKDFKNFLKEAHKRGIKVITELVLNHTSDQHSWFRKSRRAKPGSKWREFYVWSDTPNKYLDARVIFKDFESSNWTWDPVAKAYYWHRFYSHQPDLNYDNPKVHDAIFQVLAYWLEMGVDGVRLDAVPYLYEREGTNCENLPETHAFLKKLRAFVDSRFKNKMLLAEANQWPTDAVAYFGDGDECHMVFHFPLMPRMFLAIKLEDRFPLIDIITSTPQIPENCSWALFLRNHDELTLEMVTDEERDFMYRVYAKEKDARINLGIRRRLAPLLKGDRRQIELMNVMLFTLPGTPVIYYGDEIGMGDNLSLGDRNGVRTPMQWSSGLNAGFSKASPRKLYLPVITDPKYHYEAVNVENQLSDQDSLLWWMRGLITLRKRFKAFSRGTLEFLYPENNKILAYVREYKDEKILVAINLSRRPQVAELDLSKWEGYVLHELLGGTRLPKIQKTPYTLIFDPYGYYIFVLLKEQQQLVARFEAEPEIRIEDATSELFKGKPKERLEKEAIPAYIKGCRWFGGKGKEVELVKIREAVAIEYSGSSKFYLLVLDVFYTEGLPETYLLPLGLATGDLARKIDNEERGAVIARFSTGMENGILYDASYDKYFRNILLWLIATKKELKGSLGRLVSIPSEKFFELKFEEILDIESHIMRAEQSNTSFVYEDKAVLKLFRRLEEGINPELEIGEALTSRGFPHIPPYLGHIYYQEPGSEPSIVAILQGFIKNQGDAWQLFQEELKKYYARLSLSKPLIAKPNPLTILDASEQDIPRPIAELMGEETLNLLYLLGIRTGEFHLALLRLKDLPEFSPEPYGYLYQVALAQAMRSYAKRVIEQGSKLLNQEKGQDFKKVLEKEDIILQRFSALTKLRIDAKRIRIHGDYHLGQVLYNDKDFVIIDFEGEPARPLSERRLRRSPLRDVAGMLRSFHYAAYVALSKLEGKSSCEEWAELWHHYASAVFLKAYLRTVEGSVLIPKDRNALKVLLDAFLLEKAIYELHYEMNNRPEWIRIPIKGIVHLLGQEG